MGKAGEWGWVGNAVTGENISRNVLLIYKNKICRLYLEESCNMARLNGNLVNQVNTRDEKVLFM